MSVTIKVDMAVVPHRRRLRWFGAAPDLFNHARYDVKALLKTRYPGYVVDEPTVVAIRVENVDPVDLTPDCFDDGHLLMFDIEERIVGIVSVASSPGYASLPDIIVSGSKVMIRPSVIVAGQAVTVTLLVNGEAPILTCLSQQTGVNVIVDSPHGL